MFIERRVQLPVHPPIVCIRRRYPREDATQAVVAHKLRVDVQVTHRVEERHLSGAVDAGRRRPVRIEDPVRVALRWARCATHCPPSGNVVVQLVPRAGS